MKYLLILFIGLLFIGCDCDSSKTKDKPYYNICDDVSCENTLTYTQQNNCLTYLIIDNNYKTSCGEVRIYYKNGAKPITQNQTQSTQGIY